LLEPMSLTPLPSLILPRCLWSDHAARHRARGWAAYRLPATLYGCSLAVLLAYALLNYYLADTGRYVQPRSA
jgi:hypothetical protein